MLTTPFLTALDERARIKGSRDPLGLQSIWARLGRHVVGNLTTVTQSLREFTVLLLGVDLIERVAEEGGPESEVATFLRWEQLAAFARVVVNQERGVRGTLRVRRFLEQGSRRVTLSAAPGHQILGNQATYGIWGLYTVAARASALIEPRTVRLTPPGRALVEDDYHPRLAKGGAPIDELTRLIAKPEASLAIEGAQRKWLEAVAGVLGRRITRVEREVYRRHLVDGGPADPTEGRQAALAQLLDAEPLSPRQVERLAERARDRGQEPLADRLERILACESVLAPADAAFGLILGSDGTRVEALADHLHRAWGRVETIDVDAVRALRAELELVGPGVGDRFVTIADALAAGDYVRVIEQLVAQNRWVMAERGGAPWVVESDRRLQVHAETEPVALPSREALPTLWRFPYFIDSLRSITRSLAWDAR